jgi:exopolysaccharide production protein ExoZ
MFFYLIFTGLLFVNFRYRLALGLLVFGTAFIIANHAGDSAARPVMAFYGNPRIFEFWAGMLIGYFYLRRTLSIPRLACVTLIIAGFLVLAMNYDAFPAFYRSVGESSLSYLVPSAAIVLGVVGLEYSGGVTYHKLPTLLGDASYSIYLGHIFLFGVARTLWAQLHVERVDALHAILFALFGMTWCLLGSVLIYRILERPITRALQSMYRRTILTARGE